MDAIQVDEQVRVPAEAIAFRAVRSWACLLAAKAGTLWSLPNHAVE